MRTPSPRAHHGSGGDPADVTAPDPLAALAERFGVPLALVEALDERGLLPREPDGSVGARAAGRVRLLASAVDRDVPAADLLEAMQSYGAVLAASDALGLTATPHEAEVVVEREVGLDPEVADQVLAAAGMSATLTVEDVEALRSAKRALDLGLPLPVLLHLVRVFADHMGRLAEAESRIVHDHVHELMRAAGPGTPAPAGNGLGLLELVEPAVVYFHRRAWTAATQREFIRHLTEHSRPLPTEPGTAPCAVMFADLSGFTPLTAAMGDHAAAEVLSRFSTAVRQVAADHDGRVVKQIGDAFMLVFHDRLDAVRCGACLLAWCALEPRFPPLHVGAHSGEVLFHEGDYVGTAVNVAARVASVTEPSQFLVTADLLDGLALPADLSVERLGERLLKGLPEPFTLSAVALAGTQPVRRDRDAVCGMALDEPSEVRRWAGRTWSFCSSACAEAFTADPERYAAAP